MDAVEREVRKFVFDYFVDETFAPAVEEIAGKLGLSLSEARAALQRLEDGHHLKLLEGTSRILMVFPLSSIATPYRVTRANGRRYFANCAWDAIAVHPLLEEPVQVDSFCSHCGEAIRFRLEQGKGVPMGEPLPLVHLRLPAAEWWKDITRTCANTMVFLGSGAHHRDGKEPSPAPPEGVVTVDQVVGMSLPIYSGKLRKEYERPPTAVIQAQFNRLGLTGPYWKL